MNGRLVYKVRQARYSFIDAYGQMNTAISSDKQVASLFRNAVDEALAGGEASYTMDKP